VSIAEPVGKPEKMLLALGVPPLCADWIAERKSLWNCSGSTPFAWSSWENALAVVDGVVLVPVALSASVPVADVAVLLLDVPLVMFCWFFRTDSIALWMIEFGLLVDPLVWADCRAEVTAD
jgi:hypothetical protein